MITNYGLTIVKDYPIKGVNFIDINGLLATPKYFTAVIEQFVETIKQALPGIDTTRTNLAGKTALDLAKEKNFPEIIELLTPKQ